MLKQTQRHAPGKEAAGGAIGSSTTPQLEKERPPSFSRGATGAKRFEILSGRRPRGGYTKLKLAQHAHGFHGVFMLARALVP